MLNRRFGRRGSAFCTDLGVMSVDCENNEERSDERRLGGVIGRNSRTVPHERCLTNGLGVGRGGDVPMRRRWSNSRGRGFGSVLDGGSLRVWDEKAKMEERGKNRERGFGVLIWCYHF